MAFDRHDDGFIGGAGLDSDGARLFCFPVLLNKKKSDLSKRFRPRFVRGRTLVVTTAGNS